MSNLLQFVVLLRMMFNLIFYYQLNDLNKLESMGDFPVKTQFIIVMSVITYCLYFFIYTNNVLLPVYKKFKDNKLVLLLVFGFFIIDLVFSMSMFIISASPSSSITPIETLKAFDNIVISCTFINLLLYYYVGYIKVPERKSVQEMEMELANLGIKPMNCERNNELLNRDQAKREQERLNIDLLNRDRVKREQERMDQVKRDRERLNVELLNRDRVKRAQEQLNIDRKREQERLNRYDRRDQYRNRYDNRDQYRNDIFNRDIDSL